MDDKHTLFYQAYNYLHESTDLTADMYLSVHRADDLDQLIWTALGYPDQFHLDDTSRLTPHDCSRLKMLCPPHGYTILKMMLARMSTNV